MGNGDRNFRKQKEPADTHWGAKAATIGAKQTAKTRKGHSIVTHRGAKGPWVKPAQEAPEAIYRESADMWKEYNTNKGNATGGQYRDSQRDDTPYDFRGWKKGWHQG